MIGNKIRVKHGIGIDQVELTGLVVDAWVAVFHEFVFDDNKPRNIRSQRQYKIELLQSVQSPKKWEKFYIDVLADNLIEIIEYAK